MLVYFRCKNFSSFKDEAVLDMRAVKAYKEHPYNLIDGDKQDSLLKVVAVYGANASGKTNLIEAISYFRNIVRSSFQSNNKNENQSSVLENYYFPFYLSEETQEGATEFEIVLRLDDGEYTYGFIYDRLRIREEWLYKKKLNSSRTATILERKKEIELGSSVKKACEKYKYAIDDDVLALSFFSSLSLRNKVFEKTMRGIIEIFPIHSDDKMEKALLDRYFRYIYSEEDKPHLLAFLNAIDVGITDIEVLRNSQNQNYEVHLIHREGKGEYARFPMNIESAGTIKAISLFSVMRTAAVMNKTILIDEFNTKLHPLLQKFLIDLFYEGTKAGQLIYTTHDTTLLDKKYIRRDQICFVEKNSKGESSVYSLSDFKVRNDRSFEKDYLAGIYGGIPILKEFSFTEG